MLDDWCTQLGRDPGEIERSTADPEGPDSVGDSLYELGERLITISTDGRTGFDLGLVRDWIQFRDERNGGRL